MGKEKQCNAFTKAGKGKKFKPCRAVASESFEHLKFCATHWRMFEEGRTIQISPTSSVRKSNSN